MDNNALIVSINGIHSELFNRESELRLMWTIYQSPWRLKTWSARMRFLQKAVATIREINKLKMILRDLIILQQTVIEK